MRFFKVFFLFVLSLSIHTVKAQEDYTARIAVVDVEAILEHSLAISHIKKSINELSEDVQKELAEKENEFKEQEQKLLSVKETMSEEKFEASIGQFNKKVGEVQKNIKTKKIALDQAHAEAIEVVHKATISIISELAKKYSFNIVLPSTQVLYVKNELNLTLEVISNLNSRLKEVPIDYKKFIK